ncbi:hypothetical protein HIM_12218 [Hirsutella minnesotensis 3608]|uniref:Uncharacterized protein n=1 Tax=Hirsutella minnesotensis 3608 TaxID=1043627 RepID=A0A0F7ZQS9_9HYPO|nr:hypothetical protein HIM_12218 [Hirsutella minnesotensis 3608]
MRKPLWGTQGSDPTTAKLTDDLVLTGAKSANDIVRGAMRSEFEVTTGFLRTIWVWGLGYVLRERIADWRVGVLLGTGALELTSNYTVFEALRQEMLNNEATADETGDSLLRADARRAVLEFYNLRSFRRITGRGNSPVASYEGDALATLTAGAGWAGPCYEIATLVFPELECHYTPLGMMEKMAAMTNAIASLPRDQREGTTNALIPVYTELAGDLAADLMRLCDYIDTADGQELSIIGHHVAATNNHSRYSLLAVFLAAARLGKVSLATGGFCDVWTAKAITYTRKIRVPIGCVSTPQEDRKLRIVHAVSRLWIYIQLADQDGTDGFIELAQRALHKFVDEEVQGICWRRVDPAVLWAVAAALFWTMSNVDSMGKLLLRGDRFKSLYVETEGFEDVWLREIYDSKR